MNTRLKLILSSFTRQKSVNDCGAACLQIIFNYNGINTILPEEANDQPFSLWRLQELAKKAGLSARAVRMDIEHLRNSKYPCILHVITGELVPHFIVLFYYDKEMALYLVGDPDSQVCFINEKELTARWQSQSALYFENLSPASNWAIRLYPWKYLWKFDFVPGILWFSVPLLNVCASMLGLGATIVIEKAVSQPFLNGSRDFMVVVFLLLSSLSAAKCGIGYIRQQLVIQFTGKLDLLLYQCLTAHFGPSIFETKLLVRRYFETIKDVQRVHQSVSVLIGGVLSDGLMLLVMIVTLYFYFPLLVILEISVVTLLVFLTDRQLPFMLINYRSPQPALDSSETKPEHLESFGMEANAALSHRALQLSANANKLSFYFDAISSLNILLVLGYALNQLQFSVVSYQEFIFGIILCYAVVAIASKICNQLFLVAQGAERLGRRSKKG